MPHPLIKSASSYNKSLVSRRTMLQLTAAGLTGSKLFAQNEGSHPKAPSSEANRPPLRFGVNYVPRKNWWYSWGDWNATSVGQDFRAIADLGMDHIRIHCLWPIFQPGPNYVSAAALDRLHQMLDLANASHLDVEVAVLDGWLSGFAFLPSWVAPLATDPDFNLFTHPEILRAEQLLFNEQAALIGKHPRFLGFDLGNEISVLQMIESLHSNATPEQSDRWATTMLEHCNRVAPGKFHVNGVGDTHWFCDFGFRRQNLATQGSATVLHCYAHWSEVLKIYRYNEPGSLHLAEYMIELASAYAQDVRRSVWLQEVGTSNEWMPEDYLSEYSTALLRNAATARNLWGITWWCSHDIDTAIKGFLSLEYGLGLLDVKNRVKPIGKTVAKLAEEFRAALPAPTERPLAIVIPDQSPTVHSQVRDFSILRQFTNLLADGKHASIVLESKSQDENYLRLRGIKELVKLQRQSQAPSSTRRSSRFRGFKTGIATRGVESSQRLP